MEEQILKLIKRYENKYQYLLKQHSMNVEFQNGLLEGIELAIHDLQDILDGLEM